MELMQDFEFANWVLIPVALLLGALIIAGFWFYQTARKTLQKDSNTVLVANSIRLRRTAAYQQALKRLWVQIIAVGIIAAVAGSAAAFAIAKPVAVSIDSPEKHNRDIALCLDASASMFDVNIDVLTRFKEMAKEFNGERISLTVFNATSMQVFPLTDDYDYIEANLDKVINVFQKNYNDPETAAFLASTLGREEGASLIGDGLYGCTLSFDNQKDTKRSRSVIFATDNVVNGKELVPLDEAAQIAKDRNLRVYGMNPGSRGASGVVFVPDSAIASMKEAVELTGGKFFDLSDSSAPGKIVDEISSTETSIIKGSPMVVKKDQPELLLYLISGVFALFIGLLVWRKM
jgi:Ca-activated chloride channel family protein